MACIQYFFALQNEKMSKKSQAENELLVEININNIKKDEERLKVAKQVSQHFEDQTIIESDENTDIDDLAKYSHEEDDGVKVLDNTTVINRKAIFHDLYRLKHWRESMDQGSEEISGLKQHSTLSSPEESVTVPVMEQNIDLILNSLPDVQGNDASDDAAAIEKLNELENKLERKYSLQGGK